MKKFISLLLVLALVSGAVFAGFSGNAKVELGYDLDTKEYGFVNKKSVSVDVNFLELIGEAKGEGDIYAEIKATLNFNLNTGDEGSVKGINTLGVFADADWSAKIIGDGWYVGILEAPRAANFAKSAIDSKELKQTNNDSGYKRDDKDYYADVRARDFFDRTSGIEIGVAGAKIGLGLIGNATENHVIDTGKKKPATNLFASVVSPDFTVADGTKVTVGASGSYYKASDSTVAATADVKTGASFSVKGAYDVDGVKASIASDLVYFAAHNTAADDKFNADVALNVQVAPVALDVYYATQERYTEASDKDAASDNAGKLTGVDNLLSAKVVTDLKNFDVPVVVTLTGKDLINNQDLGLKAAVTVAEGLTITPAGGYVINTKVWNAGADVEYKTDAFTAKVGGKFSATAGTADTSRLQLSASVESSAIVPGATLALGWNDADRDQNLLDGQAKAKNLGRIVASAKIAF